MSRASVVAMLIAAEVLIVGLAVYTVTGGAANFAGGMHHVDFTPVSLSPVEAGESPHVVIDDVRSRVRVAVSSDGLVHVRDLTEMHGAIFSSGKYPQLHVTRTSDGVRIERPSAERLSIGIFGFSTEAIEVSVPPRSYVEIARCAGADVDGVAGGVNVQSQDGHVKLADLQGTVDARSDDGYLDATNVQADRLALHSKDGHLALHDVTVGSLVATTQDGRIEASDLRFSGGQPDATLHTDDGPIKLQLAPNANLTIDASTGDGHIVVDGSSSDRDDSAQRTIRLGAGAGRMTVGTSDGSIHIFTNGAILQ
jgi:hypothetical protein